MSGSVRTVPLGLGSKGLGGIARKTLRDSLPAVAVVGGLIGLLVAAGGLTMSSTYGSAEARLELGVMARAMPESLRGLYGEPLNLETIGGFITWHYGAYLALLGGLWSVVALGGTLAGEAAHGSLELVLATGRSRRAIAMAKVAGHLAGWLVVGVAVSVIAWATGIVFELMPGDPISPGAAIAFGAGLAVRGVAAGAVGFAIAPIVGRGAGTGIGGAVLLGGYIAQGYRGLVAGFEPIAAVTPSAWLARHLPLAGHFDWPAVGFTALVAAVLLAIGIELFARRDVGVTVALPMPGRPRVLAGTGGPVRLALAELLRSTWWWGVGLAIYAFAMVVVATAMLDLLESAPEMQRIFRAIIPDIDITTMAGMLEYSFVDFGFLLAGLAATTFLAGRWSDEGSGRLELLLATPLGRGRWLLATGGGVLGSIGAAMAVLALAVGVTIGSAGEDPAGPVLGIAVLALYGAAVGGLGMGAGGLWGGSAAARVAGAVTVGTFLLDTLAPILRLPGWVSDLALTTHLGAPVIGRWNAVGIALCLALAVGGLAIGVLGMRRRDLAA